VTADRAVLLSFTPSAQDVEVLEALTVGRQALIRELLDDVDELVRRGNRHHRLIIGPRGIGKSHLLTVLADRASKRYGDSEIQIFLLPEDLWGIRGLVDLAQAMGYEPASPADAPPSVEERAEQWLRRLPVGSGPVVLLLENLDVVLRSIGLSSTRRLRSLLEDCSILLIASAPQLFDSVLEVRESFFGFFDIATLEELSTDDALELFCRLAALWGDGELLGFLNTAQARDRVEAIRVIAGGHPRIWTLFAGCLSVSSIDLLVPLFIETVDHLTPYYQSLISSLSSDEQAIVVALCRTRGGHTGAEIGIMARLDDDATTSALRDLERKGFVRRLDSSKDRRAEPAWWWELREPLMRLAMDIKESQGRPIGVVVEFLREWYGSRLAEISVSGPLARAYVSEALAQAAGELPIAGSPWSIASDNEKSSTSEPSDVSGGRGHSDVGPSQNEGGGSASAAPEYIGASSSTDLAGDSESPGLSHPSSGEGEPLAATNRAIELDPDNPDYHNNRAYDLRALGRHEEALAANDRAIELDPDNPAHHRARSVSLNRLGRHEEALAAYDRAIELDPDNADYHNNRAYDLRALGRHEEALAANDRAVELDPDNPGYQRNRASTLEGMGRYEDALVVYDRAIELDPDNPAHHRARSVSLNRLGRYEEALAADDRAVELDPDNPDYHDNRAYDLRALGRHEEALAATDRAVELDPDNPDYQRNRAITLEGMGRYEDALVVYDRAIELDPDNPVHHRARSVSLNRLGRYEEALAADDRAVELDPDNADYHNNRAYDLRALGRHEEALAATDRAVELDPDSPDYQRKRAITLEGMGRYEDALVVYDRAIELDPDNPAHHRARSVSLNRLGRHEEALAATDRAIELDPDNPDYHNNRAYDLRALSRHEEALAATDRAVELDPDNPDYQRNRAITLEGMGRYEDALVVYDRAIELDPDNPAHHRARSVSLNRLGRHEEALAADDRAIELDPDNPAHHRARSVSLNRLGRHEEALAATDRAVELDPDNPDYHNNRAYDLRALSRHEEALAANDRAVELDPDNPDYQRNRAITLEGMGRYEEALQIVEELCRVAPTGSVLNTLANQLRQADRYLEAIEVAKRAVAAAPTEPVYHFTLAENLMASGDDRWRTSIRTALSLANKLPTEHVAIVVTTLMEHFAATNDPSSIDEVVDLYHEFGQVPQLATGLVAAISTLPDDPDASSGWRDAWRRAAGRAPHLQIAVEMMDTAAAWLGDHDPVHLYRLSAEQRVILTPILAQRTVSTEPDDP
jgi:tetratricopeptide (TPR) repeat protein